MNYLHTKRAIATGVVVTSLVTLGLSGPAFAAGPSDKDYCTDTALALSDGYDVIFVQPGGIRHNGTGDDEVFIGTSGVDDIDGKGGDDVICGFNGADELRGGSGDDSIFGYAGNDDIWGERHDDFIDGGFGSDDIRGGDGEDELVGGDQDDEIRGGDGADELDMDPNRRAGTDDLRGGSGNDSCGPADGGVRNSC